MVKIISKSERTQNNTLPESHEGDTKRKRLVLWMSISLVIIVLASFSSVFKNGFVDYDDKKFIYNNLLIKELNSKSLVNIFTEHNFTPWYKPLVYLSWAIEKKIFGLNPVVFHTTNLLFHIANTIFLFLILLKLFRKTYPQNEFTPWIALLVAALFGISPLKVESVAWAVERKDVMFGFFYLSSLYCYVNYLTGRKYYNILVGSILFLFGLMCKSMIITLPVILFLIDFLFKRKINFNLISEKVPFFIVLLIGLGFYGFFWSPPHAYHALTPGREALHNRISIKSFPNKPTYMAYKASFHSSRLTEWVTRSVVPYKLSVVYPLPKLYYPDRYKLVDLVFVLPILLMIAAGIFFYNRIRALTAAIAFYFITILPVLNIYINESYVSDRYTYFPSIGIYLLIGIIVLELASRWPKIKYFLLSIFAVYLLFFGVSTYLRVKVWHDSITLFEDLVTRFPKLYFGYTSLGNSYLDLGKPEKAIQYFNKSHELNPNQAIMLNARGLAKHHTGDYAGALRDYDLAIRMEPTFSLALSNRGITKLTLGQTQEALKDFNEALRLDNEYVSAYNGRGMAWQKLEEYQKAIQDFTTCLKYNPYYVMAYINRGNTRILMKDYQGAIADFTLSFRISPNNVQALHGLGYTKLSMEDYQGAVQDFTRTINMYPSYSLAYFNRGVAKFHLNDLAAACRDWNDAYRLGYTQALGFLNNYCK
ncbi:MAG: tetratricopeptide repeat protein [Bacteroidetes bacterium]|nr:tetratricopeptide repeat protein [Bacteroidota bacterium]